MVYDKGIFEESCDSSGTPPAPSTMWHSRSPNHSVSPTSSVEGMRFGGQLHDTTVSLSSLTSHASSPNTSGSAYQSSVTGSEYSQTPSPNRSGVEPVSGDKKRRRSAHGVVSLLSTPSPGSSQEERRSCSLISSLLSSSSHNLPQFQSQSPSRSPRSAAPSLSTAAPSPAAPSPAPSPSHLSHQLESKPEECNDAHFDADFVANFDNNDMDNVSEAATSNAGTVPTQVSAGSPHSNSQSRSTASMATPLRGSSGRVAQSPRTPPARPHMQIVNDILSQPNVGSENADLVSLSSVGEPSHASLACEKSVAASIVSAGAYSAATQKVRNVDPHKPPTPPFKRLYTNHENVHEDMEQQQPATILAKNERKRRRDDDLCGSKTKKIIIIILMFIFVFGIITLIVSIVMSSKTKNNNNNADLASKETGGFLSPNTESPSNFISATVSASAKPETNSDLPESSSLKPSSLPSSNGIGSNLFAPAPPTTQPISGFFLAPPLLGSDQATTTVPTTPNNPSLERERATDNRPPSSMPSMFLRAPTPRPSAIFVESIVVEEEMASYTQSVVEEEMASYPQAVVEEEMASYPQSDNPTFSPTAPLPQTTQSPTTVSPTSQPTSLPPTTATPTFYPTYIGRDFTVNSAILGETGVLTGKQSRETFGYSTALSLDGKVLVVGAPYASSVTDVSLQRVGRVQVFTKQRPSGDESAAATWEPRGNEIVGDNTMGQLGYTVAVNQDGSIIVASEPTFGDDRRGRIRIFEWNGNSYQLQHMMEGTEDSHHYGVSLSLTPDGRRLAIGSPYHSLGRTLSLSGQVQVIERVSSGAWQFVGNPLQGSSATDWFGWSVDLTHDGNILVVGAPRNKDYGGYVRCFIREEIPEGDSVRTVWTSVGRDIVNELVPADINDLFGHVVSVSRAMSGSKNSTIISNGNKIWIAIGCPWKSIQNSPNSGLVAVYQYADVRNPGLEWELVGSPMKPSNPSSDQLGYSLKLLSNVLAVGSPGTNDRQGEISVYVWEQEKVLWERSAATVSSGGTSNGDDYGFSMSVAIDKDNGSLVCAVGAVMLSSDGDDPSGYVRLLESSPLTP